MANAKTISQFKSKLSGGGARPNLFEVTIPSFPAGITGSPWNSSDEGELFKFMCKSAALPASNVAPIDVPFRGRILKVAGDRTFDVWTVTVINDENFKLRTAFDRWMNGLSKLSDNTGITNPTSYMANAYVQQLGRGEKADSTDNNGGAGGQHSVLRTYKFFDVFPTNISAIDLSYDSSDTIEDFTVEFQVQYWTVGDTTSSASGSTVPTPGTGEVEIK